MTDETDLPLAYFLARIRESERVTLGTPGIGLAGGEFVFTWLRLPWPRWWTGSGQSSSGSAPVRAVTAG